MLDSFRIDLITGIPKEMLGTKSPIHNINVQIFNAFVFQNLNLFSQAVKIC